MSKVEYELSKEEFVDMIKEEKFPDVPTKLLGKIGGEE